jgi:uncharacterized membrane protein YeaQ/YmgE (transglycosylase-associated protein family)
MSILAWIVLGLLAGFIGSKIVVGGWLFNTFGHSGVNGLNLYSLLVAVVGAVIVLVVYHALVGGTRRTTI